MFIRRIGEARRQQSLCMEIPVTKGSRNTSGDAGGCLDSSRKPSSAAKIPVPNVIAPMDSKPGTHFDNSKVSRVIPSLTVSIATADSIDKITFSGHVDVTDLITDDHKIDEGLGKNQDRIASTASTGARKSSSQGRRSVASPVIVLDSQKSNLTQSKKIALPAIQPVTDATAESALERQVGSPQGKTLSVKPPRSNSARTGMNFDEERFA